MSEGFDAQMMSDAEQVAALIEGRLSPSARAALLDRLSQDPEWRDVLMVASEVLNQATPLSDGAAEGAPVAAPSSSNVLPFAPRVKRWRWTYAAAAVMVGVIGFSYWTNSQMTISPPPALILAMVEPPTMELVPNGGADVSPALSRWTRVRAATNALPARAIAVRLGALASATLQASRASDSAVVQVYRDDLRALLDQLPGSSPFAMALDTARDPQSLFTLFQQVRTLVDGAAFDAGAMLALAHVRTDIASDRLITLLAADSAADPEVARHLSRLHETGVINAPNPSAATIATLDSG